MHGESKPGLHIKILETSAFLCVGISFSIAPMSMFAAYTVRAHRSTSSGVCGRSCGFTGMTLVRLRTTRIGLPPISVPDMRSAASAALGAPNATNAKYPSELESAHK